MDYPIFKKDGRCITAVLSPSKFLQVEMNAGIAQISAGDNANVVNDALSNDDLKDPAELAQLYNTVNQHITTHLELASQMAFQKGV